MGKRKGLGIIAWLFLAAAFTIYAIIFNRTEPKQQTDFSYPPAPTERSPDGYWEYNSDEQIWIFKYFSPDRAIDNSKPELDLDAIDRHLEKNIDGYLEDTYWGEEWDLTDKDD